MTLVAAMLLGAALATGLYAYLGYPLVLFLARAPRRTPPRRDGRWPLVSIVLPAHNEAVTIGGALDAILGADYPPDRRQVLVVSDASTDGMDDIVRSYADRGVELVRLPARSGKTAAENAALPHLRGDVVICTDASVRLHPTSLRTIVRAFDDPSVGVASGRDVSVSSRAHDPNEGESGYVGYEMWVRDLETAAGGIIGASGCFYAVRRALHEVLVPEALSRDFAAPLVAREHGFRAVSVRDATCQVPRTGSLRLEYRRKVRTMTRGIQTLYYKRALLNPWRFGRFSLMLWSHKVARWLAAPAAILGMAGLAVLAPDHPWAFVALLAVIAVLLGGGAAWVWPSAGSAPRALMALGFLVWGNVAVLHAWVKALSRDLSPVWEPTRRDPLEPAGSPPPGAS